MFIVELFVIGKKEKLGEWQYIYLSVRQKVWFWRLANVSGKRSRDNTKFRAQYTSTRENISYVQIHPLNNNKKYR